MPEWFGGSKLNSELLVPKERHWIHQWNRVRRFYTRTKKLKKKSERCELTDFDRDDILSYFMHALHLRDWIACSHQGSKKELDDLFQKFEMGCCRDITNGFKHKKLSKPSIDADFNWYRVYDHFETKQPIKYWLAFEDPADKEIKKYEIFELIRKVHILWQEFIEKKID